LVSEAWRSETGGLMDLDIAESLVASEKKQDLVDALASSGTGLDGKLGTKAKQLRREIGALLARSQAEGAIRDDVTTDDLMALISGALFSLRARSAGKARPERTLAVLRDGLRAGSS